MIHRIDRVNPDVDDRVIKPNEARMATNLRFGASTEDTNLSGGTLILGNTELPFTPPAGTNKVVGVYADLELRNVYFALYNSLGNHGLYQIETENNNQVNLILTGAWLNLQGSDDYNVSMTSVAGLLYWTDNVNEPRMVNIAKGIRTQQNPNGVDVYPVSPEDWHYAQIKRPPAWPLIVSELTQEEVSITFLNKSNTKTGLQYSYYYIYDNGEESRLAPYSIISFKTSQVDLRIPDAEFNFYTKQYQIIKSVVVVVRNGNDGVWRELVYRELTQNLFISNLGFPITAAKYFSFKDVLINIKNPVASDIIESRYDSVPLLSKTNEIAQNRINHANYILDRSYNDYKLDYVKIDSSFNFSRGVYQNVFNLLTSNEKYNYSFLPWGRYTFGLEFVDKYGRTFPVGDTVDVVAPYLDQNWFNQQGLRHTTGFLPGGAGSINIATANGQAAIPLNEVQIKEINQGKDFFYEYNLLAEFRINGTKPLPYWVDKVNIVRSKAKNIVKITQGLGYIFLWYKNQDGSDSTVSLIQPQLAPYYIGPYNQYLNIDEIYDLNTPQTTLTFNGYIIKFDSENTPIVYEEDMYITLSQFYNYINPATSVTGNNPSYAYWNDNVLNGSDAARFGTAVKYKIVKIVGDLMYIKAGSDISLNPSWTSTVSSTQTNAPITLTPYSYANSISNQKSSFQANDARAFLSRAARNNTLLTYHFVVTVEKNIEDQAVYTTARQYSATEFNNAIATNFKIVGYLNGDGYICKYKKYIRGISQVASIYVFSSQAISGPFIANNETMLTRAFSFTGSFISMSPLDIYVENWSQNIGQINTTSYEPRQPQRLENGICFSAPFIPGTQINGLNKFNSLDYRLAPSENGPITSLVVTNATQREPGVMLAIGSFGISSFYYDAIQLNNVDGSANVTTTNTYLASQRPLLGQYGTTRPMSISKTPLGTVYWWSDVVNDLIRYTNAGLERLGMTFSFANYLRKKYNNNPLIITWYDQVTDEINLLGNRELASVFSERYKTFQGERSYYNDLGQSFIYPERGIGIATKQFLFIEGKIWVTDVELQGPNAPDDNFIFGSYKDPEINIVTNENPAVVKRWNQIKLFGSRPNTVFLEAPDETEGPGGILTSYIDTGYWIKRKGDWEAAIRRADNTNGGLMAGKLMESRIIYSKFAWSAQGFQKLNFIEVKSNVSLVQ